MSIQGVAPRFGALSTSATRGFLRAFRPARWTARILASTPLGGGGYTVQKAVQRGVTASTALMGRCVTTSTILMGSLHRGCIPSSRSAELCKPRLVTALSRPERGPEGGNCTERYARGGRRSPCANAASPLLLITLDILPSTFSVIKEFPCE